MPESTLRILIVDDERAIRRFLRAALTSHGYQIFEAENGQMALAAAAENRPDVVILDLGLPDMDGVEVTRQLREWYQAPIVILSVRDQENDKIAALDAGADDYLTKPFGVGELMARIRVILRRSTHPVDEPVYEIDDLKVDLPRRLVTLQGQEVELTPTEYDILRVLVQHAGRVLTHRQILRDVWGVPYETETHLLRVNMSNLRRKIEPDPNQPHYIVTEPGVGYRLRTGA
jgi:two-component system, OmpR family, KDP operon response regulator KdpE